MRTEGKEFVNGRLRVVMQSRGLHSSRIDRRPGANLRPELEHVRKQAWPFAVAGRPTLLDARSGDAVRQLPPRKSRIIFRKLVKGVGVHEAAPLHRDAEPRAHPGRRTEYRD